jgi:hypothetical protein
MLAVFFPVEVDQPVAVAVLFLLHGAERLRGGGIIPADAFRQVGVDAAVLFLGLDGEGENFLRSELTDCLGHELRVAGASEGTS